MNTLVKHMNDAGRRPTPPGRYREVSELRIQHKCEYRLRLRQTHGDRPTESAVVGSVLHSKVKGLQPEGRSISLWLKLLIVMITLLAAVLWILG